MDISNIISLLGGVALFLFGMTLMGDGLKKVAGNRLELLLYRLTNTPLKGILLGTGVTAIIQSSSATSVMVVGFVNSGMMKFRQAIGIILGAILGTSVTGWIICLSDLSGGNGFVSLLSTATLTGIIAIIGIILRLFCKKNSHIHVGDIMLGFAVLMLGMNTMSSAVSPLRESEAFIQTLTVFSNPLLCILVGALFTCLLQSASAAIGILQALTITGALDFATVFPLIMGIAIGAALPVLLSALGANTNGKRTAFVYLLIDVLGVIICGTVFYSINAIYPIPFFNMTMTTFSIALVNTSFRLAVVLVLCPFLGVLEKIVCRLVKEKEAPKEVKPSFIAPEDRFLPFPPLAVAQCRNFIIDMAQHSKDCLITALGTLQNYNDADFQKVADLEEQLDRYEDNIWSYLMKVTQYDLNEEQNAEVSRYLHALPDLERISDHALNVAQIAQEINRNSVIYSGYSDAAKYELSVLQNALIEIMTNTVDAFVQNDLQMAAKVEPLEEVIDMLCDEMKLHHVSRLQKGICGDQSFTFNDLLTNYERISDHCSNIALAMIILDTDTIQAHEYIQHMEQTKQAFFTQHFDEYREKYAI